MDSSFIYGDNGEVKNFILYLTGKLPGEIRDMISRECMVVTINNGLDGFYVPSELVSNRSLIVIDSQLHIRDVHRFIRTFYHEVAHHWLKHRVLFGSDKQREQYQEDEAERMVSAWLMRPS